MAGAWEGWSHHICSQEADECWCSACLPSKPKQWSSPYLVWLFPSLLNISGNILIDMPRGLPDVYFHFHADSNSIKMKATIITFIVFWLFFKKNFYVCVCVLICMWAHVLRSAQAWHWCLTWLLLTLLRQVKEDPTNLPSLSSQIAPEISWPYFPSAGFTDRPSCSPGIFISLQGNLSFSP